MTDFDQMSPAQRVAQFHKMHGDDCIEICGFYCFSNGAKRDVNPMGLLQPPSTNPQLRARDILAYWEKCVEREETRFEERKQHYVSQLYGAMNPQGPAANPPPYDEKTISDDLDGLRKRVRNAQAQVRKVRRDLSDSLPDDIKARHKEWAENKQRGQRVLDAISQIKI